MKITLNKSFCERIWKTHIARIREPTRIKKVREAWELKTSRRLPSKGHHSFSPKDRARGGEAYL